MQRLRDFWLSSVYPFLFPECPCCDGRGGWVETVLDYGEGPYYPCHYCKEEGRVFFLSLYLWKWWEWTGKR